jgi:3-oxoacyl-[acyl-carrier-protein] synthase III
LCLRKAGIEAEQLSKIIVTRFLGDRLLPMTASFVQQKLGCGSAVQAFDIVGGVHSFIEAMQSGACAADSDGAPVLIVSGGVIHSLISKTDPRSAFLFGDGAAAVLLAPSREPGILSSYSFCNCDFIDSASAFCLREYVGEEVLKNENYDLFYDLYREDGWKKAETFILDATAFTARALLRAAEKTAAEIDLWLITENSLRLCRAIIERLEIPEDKTLSLTSSLGNSMSAMLPLLLNKALETKRIGNGSTVMLLSIGEGLKGGGMLVRV